MNSIRTGFLLSILATLIATSAAAGFPEKPIKFVLGFGAGGPTDIVARTLAEQPLGRPRRGFGKRVGNLFNFLFAPLIRELSLLVAGLVSGILRE